MQTLEPNPSSTSGREPASSMPHPEDLPREDGPRVARALRSLVDDLSDPAVSPAAIEYASWLRLLRRATP
jgi:hypothetical protein